MIKEEAKAKDLQIKFGDKAIMVVNEILKSNPHTLSCTGVEANYRFWSDIKRILEKE